MNVVTAQHVFRFFSLFSLIPKIKRIFNGELFCTESTLFFVRFRKSVFFNILFFFFYHKQKSIITVIMNDQYGNNPIWVSQITLVN